MFVLYTSLLVFYWVNVYSGRFRHVFSFRNIRVAADHVR